MDIPDLVIDVVRFSVTRRLFTRRVPEYNYVIQIKANVNMGMKNRQSILFYFFLKAEYSFKEHLNEAHKVGCQIWAKFPLHLQLKNKNKKNLGQHVWEME